ncbi:MAG: FtsX-like permease family protein [Bifidobacteriaceae bacterium]|nr:FtsX-like permease family protein [Bifidobacteriaceae bacterium]
MAARSMTRRRSRVVIAVAAVAIGATTLFALATIATDIPRQMTREMRAYGGNLLVLPAPGLTSIDAARLSQVDALVGGDELIGSAPYRYQTVRLNEQPYLAAGTDLAAVRAVSPYWYVDGEWPKAQDEILVGSDIADWIGIAPGDRVELVAAAPDAAPPAASDGIGPAAVTPTVPATQPSASAPVPGDASPAPAAPATPPGTSAPAPAAASPDPASPGPQPTAEGSAEVVEEELAALFGVAGIVSTGGEEDSMIFLSLATLEEFTEVSGVLDAVEYSVALNGTQIDRLADAIGQEVEGVSAAGVKRLTESDTYVLDMLRSLLGLVAGIVLALTMIGVSTTMMAVVAERRNEIALRKALGAPDRAVEREFLAEGLALGVVGGVLGCGLGYGFAQAVSLTVFHRTVAFNWWLALAAVAVAAAAAYTASLLPVRRTAQIDPALVLRGE